MQAESSSQTQWKETDKSESSSQNELKKTRKGKAAAKLNGKKQTKGMQHLDSMERNRQGETSSQTQWKDRDKVKVVATAIGRNR